MKLTMPPIEQGRRRIVVDGQTVGIALTEPDDRDPWNGRWEARLWAAYDPRTATPAVLADLVSRLRLRDLRAELQRRLDEEGPWWTETGQ